MYHFISQLRKMQDNPQLLLKVLEPLLLLMQPLKCSTLQTQSLRYYSRCMTSNRSLWYSTNNQKLFQQHLVSHAFLSITFVFGGCLRLVEAFNCHSDWRQTRRNLEIPFEFLTKTENQMLYHIVSTNRNEQSDLIRSIQVRSDPYFVNATLILSRHLRSY